MDKIEKLLKELTEADGVPVMKRDKKNS